MGLSSKVRESVKMLNRGHAGSEAVLVAVVDLGRVDVVAVVDLRRVAVVTGVDSGSVEFVTVVDLGSDS